MSDAFLNSYHLETSPYVVDTMTRNTVSNDQDESKTTVPIVEREHLFNKNGILGEKKEKE